MSIPSPTDGYKYATAKPGPFGLRWKMDTALRFPEGTHVVARKPTPKYVKQDATFGKPEVMVGLRQLPPDWRSTTTVVFNIERTIFASANTGTCLLYTSDAADE